MSDSTVDALAEVRVSLANLSDAGREQVFEALLQDPPDVREVIEDAEAADAFLAQAKEFQQLQAKAVSDGNWEQAREYAQQAENALDAVADHGGSAVLAVQAAEDVAKLDQAEWQQRQANDNARAAASYAEGGDGAAAQVYAEAAGARQIQADDAGQGGLAGAREQNEGQGGLSGDEPGQDIHAPDTNAIEGQATEAAPSDAGPPPDTTTPE